MTGPPDDRELAGWIREHTPRLLGVARAFATDEAEAEDILQDVWIVAAAKAARRPAGVPLGAWLHAVTLNRGRTLWRRAARRQRLRALWSRDLLPHESAPPPTADDAIARARLWRAVAALPALQRDVLLLRLVEDLSIRDAAARLGRAEGTVKASLHRALHALRVSLGSAPAAAPALPSTLDLEPSDADR